MNTDELPIVEDSESDEDPRSTVDLLEKLKALNKMTGELRRPLEESRENIREGLKTVDETSTSIHRASRPPPSND